LGATVFGWMAVAAIAEQGLRRAGVRGRDRALALCPLVFFPPSAAHAPSFVWRDLYARFAPESVARAIGVADGAVLEGAPHAGAAAWCPSCGAQYRAGFARCADCDVTLVALTSPGP
jgi:hypothetical protein